MVGNSADSEFQSLNISGSFHFHTHVPSARSQHEADRHRIAPSDHWYQCSFTGRRNTLCKTVR